MSEDDNGPFAVAGGKLMLFMTNAIRGGVVFNRDLALKIAELLCEAHYGSEELDRQKPLSITDKDTYWRVEGSLNRDGAVDGLADISFRSRSTMGGLRISAGPIATTRIRPSCLCSRSA